MEFLGIGYQEILLILALLLVVVGPERMPEIAYQIGRAVRTLQKYARVVRDEFRDEFDYIDEQYRVVRGELETTRTSLREEQARMEREWREGQARLDSEMTAELPAPGLPSSNGGSAGRMEESPPPPAEPVAPEPPKADGPPLVF